MRTLLNQNKPWRLGRTSFTSALLVIAMATLSGQSAEARKPIKRPPTTTTTTTTTSTSTTTTQPVASTPPAIIGVAKVSSSVSLSSVSIGQVQTLKASVKSTTNLSGLIIDIRIYNSANAMVARHAFDNASLAAGVATPFQFDYTVPSTLAVGNYTAVIAVFSSSWSTYLWDSIGAFSVVSGTAPAPTTTTTTMPAPQPPAPVPSEPSTITYQAPKVATIGNFTVRGYIAKPTMAAGSIQYGKISVTAAQATGPLIISMRYLDVNGIQLIERGIHNVSFAAGQTREISMEYAFKLDTPAGTYSVGIGVFGQDYQGTYVYERGFPAFQITSSGYVPPIPTSLMPTNNLPMTSAPDAMVFNGPYFVQNNMWGSYSYPAGTYFTASAGIGPLTSTGSVSGRWNWNYPHMDIGQEVKGYPAVGFGQKPGTASTPGSNLPKLVDSITSAVSSWDVQAMYTGRGHLAFDLWLTRDANRGSCFPCTPITHEIMLAVDTYNDYAVGNPAWYFGSTVINGVTYRVWKADNFGGGGIQWRFIVLQMVNPIHVTKGSVDFKPIFAYLKSAGLISGQEYLASIEFGNEMEYGTGDVLLRDFKAEVR